MGIICVGPSDRHLRRADVFGGHLKQEPTEQGKEKPTIIEKTITEEKNSMDIRQTPLTESIGKYIYDEKYGVAILNLIEVIFIDNKDQRLNRSQVHIWQDQRFISVNQFDLRDFLVNEKWDELKFYIRDPQKQRNNYYGYRYGLVKGEEKAIKIKSLLLQFNLDYYLDFQNRRTQKASEELSVSTKKELSDLKVWCFESFRSEDLKRPLIGDIKERSVFYLLGKGTVMVKKKYDYPSRDKLICTVSDVSGEDYDIKYPCENLFYVPHGKWIDPFKVLDETFKEIALSPYVIREGKTFNVYWKPIEDAAGYIVSLYKIIVFDGRKDLYHLKDYAVDRNDKYLVVDGLIGETFIFKVSAENRTGEIIAKSRGIRNGLPDYFTTADK